MELGNFPKPAGSPGTPAPPPAACTGSGGLALAENFQVLVESIHALGGSGLHPRLEHPIAFLHRVVDRRCREGGLAVVLLQSHGFDRDAAGHALELKRPRDALRRHDLAILAVKPVLLAVGSPVNDPPRTTRAEVDVAAHHFVLPRPPPFR